MAKQSKAKQRFRERQQYNRIVSQLNTLHAAGYTDDDIRARGNKAWKELGSDALARLEAQATGAAMPTGTVPGATPGPTGYANAPAWAYNSLTATPGAFQNAINTITGQPQTTAPGAPKVMPRPTQKSDPFAGVTGSTGTNAAPVAGVGGVALAASNATPQSPYVPQWLQWWNNRTPTGVAGLATQGTRPPITAAPTLNPATIGAPGTTTGRPMNPNTGIPDFPMLSDMGSAPPSGGGGYYTNWKNYRRGRGGRGRKSRYSPSGGGFERERDPYVQSLGLHNWSIG